MGLTLSKGEFVKRVKKVCVRPHPELPRGRLICAAIGRDGDPEDTCVLISPGSSLDMTGDIILGKWVYISSGAVLYTHYHPTEGVEPLLLREERLLVNEFTFPCNKIIGDGVWIYESRVLAHCQRIARGVIIGAGSVVTKNIEEKYSIWAGNPARRIGTRVNPSGLGKPEI